MLRSLSRTLKATPTRILSPRFQSTSKEPDSTQEEARRERVQANLDQEERKRHRRVLQYTGLFTVCSSLVALAILGRKESETQDSSISAHLKRAWSKLTDSAKIVSEPQWEKLLPDVLPDPYQRPFTLVLELNDALKDIGWRVATRPGVKNFLSYLGKYYEIVLFSDSPATTTQPVVEALDPYGYAMYKLYRESTRLVGGKRVKDLNSLNRDLGKVVCVDVNPEMYRLQPENGISLKKWTGEKKDQELDRMMTFLEEIALFMTIANSTDMRPLLKLMRTINSDDLPAAWEIHKNKMRQKFANDYGAQPIKTGLFGRKNVSPQSMTVFDIIERAAREERAYFEKEKVENIAHMQKMRKEAEEEHKKQIEGLKAKKMKMLDYLFLSQQKPEDQAKY